MILTEHNICYYLLDRGMIELDSIIGGQFSARRNDSRNNNFIINKEYDKHHYFIKQVKATDQEKIDSLHAEAACYQLPQQSSEYAILQQFMPRFYGFDKQQHILVVEEIKDAISLNDYYLLTHRFDTSIAARLAELLASYHVAIATDSQQANRLSFLRRQKPWVLSLHQNNAAQWMGAAQSAEQQAMQVIFKNAEFVRLMGQQEALWQASSLIHNDVKFTNFLVPQSAVDKGVQSVKLIDWELADIGDPLWDLASVFQAYLLMWTLTDIPEQERYPGFKQIDLKQVQPSIKMAWNTYREKMKFGRESRQVLDKTVRFTAMKLLHSCFEFTPHTPSLQPISVRLLQIALNILKAPANAAIHLFGIDQS